MAETGEISQAPAKPGILHRIAGILKDTRAVFYPKPVPVQEITPGKVAQVIDRSLRNAVSEGPEEDPFSKGFDMSDILNRIGYTKMWIDQHPRDKFPEAYDRSQVALAELEKRGIIEFIRDSEDNVIRYRVIDATELGEIASKVKGS